MEDIHTYTTDFMSDLSGDPDHVKSYFDMKNSSPIRADFFGLFIAGKNYCRSGT